MREVEHENSIEKVEVNGVEIIKYNEDNCVLLHVGDTVYPDAAKVPQVPDGWKDIT